MAVNIDRTQDPDALICWGRGDTDARGFQVMKADQTTPDDITGRSYILTANTEKNPVDDANQLFQVAGVITDAANGLVEFSPAPGDTDVAPGKYFYDIQQTDVAGKIRTMIKAQLQIVQDITKI